jgi:uncharacterized membrane protein YdbT with pleckstrin-like domain
LSYIEKNLMAGETVVYRAKLHWAVFRGAVAWAVLGVVMFAGKAAPGGAFCLVMAVVVGALAYLNLIGSEFGVTNKRVMIKVGLIRRQSLETLLNKVEGVSVDQGLLGRVLGFGTISVNGTGSTKTPFKGIENPMEFRRAVQEQIEASSQRTAASA